MPLPSSTSARDDFKSSQQTRRTGRLNRIVEVHVQMYLRFCVRQLEQMGAFATKASERERSASLANQPRSLGMAQTTVT